MVDSYYENHDLTMQLQRKWDSSKPKCMWHPCRTRVDRETLFCSRTCKNKAASWDGWDNAHRFALMCFEPDPHWLDATLVDAGLWPTRLDPVKAKRLKHAKKWDAQWGPIFSRYRGALPMHKGLDPSEYITAPSRAGIYRPPAIGGFQVSHNVHTGMSKRRIA